MCRLFAALSSPPRSLEDDLLYFRHLSVVHCDGWGIAWYQRDQPVVLKSRHIALYDPLYLKAARRARSDIVVAHLRKMTRGNAREVNAHPFAYRNYVFAHNGSISKDLKYALKGRYANTKGDTDSELFLRYLIQHIEDKRRPLWGMRKAFRKIDRMVKRGEISVSTLNFTMTDGERLYAFKKRYGKNNRLFYRYKDNGFASLMVSSSPLKSEGWVEMDDGELLIADADTMDYKIFQVLS